MAIICPYCSHSTNAKGVRAGRFTPKCPKCGRSFQLVITMEGDKPSFQASPLPGDSAKSATFDPNMTAPSEALPPSKATAKQASAGEATEALPSSLAGATVAPEEGVSSANADFSVNASALKSSASSDPDATAALNETSPPSPRVDLEATEADLSTTKEEPDESADGMPAVLGGYQILKELGRGGMGAVYLARQISLDRPVALKVMNPKWASNPNFLVRFTREAYAAAQLVHHNIVQVYDIGEDKGINFFSMEFVEGSSLGSLIKDEGRLPADVAAGYVLQAARGLKFAHDRGMIHRDIKPDNLMLNTQGVVKVADLGLVRTPGMEEESPLAAATAEAKAGPRGRSLASLSNVTMVGQAMGTPSYMAPEQARDATKVDQRADIYSLGCTLYVMVTGKPVFSGSNALEVMTKHATEPVVRPEKVVKEVPKALSDVIVKMVAKKPEDRYPSMDEVIHALEDFMGLAGKDAVSQTEAHVKTLEAGVKAFLQAPAARLRSWILLGFAGGCALLILLLMLMRFPYSWTMASGIFALELLTAVSYFIVHGATHRTHLFLKCRDLLFTSSWLDLGKLALGLLIFVLALWLLGQLWIWIIAAILAVGLALGMHYAIDLRLQKERAKSVDKVEKMLRTLRIRGLSEEALHEFVAKYAGEHWEEFFEALFGYEAKLAARTQFGLGPKGPRPRFAAWRDPLVRAIDRYQRARQEARERKHLQAVEQKNLVAQGVSKDEARAQAEAVAEAMVQKAAELKKEIDMTVAEEKGVTLTESKPRPPRRVNVQELFVVAAEPPKRTVRPGVALERMLNRVFSSSLRFLLGAALLLGFLYWLHVNQSIPTTQEGATDPEAYKQIWARMQSGKMEPLKIPFVGEYLSTLNAGVAGLLLILSANWLYWRIGLLVLLGAAIMVIGPAMGLIPALGPLTPSLSCLAVGAAVALLGFLFGRGT